MNNLKAKIRAVAETRVCPVCGAGVGYPCASWNCERVHIAVERERQGWHTGRLPGEEPTP